ncbi:ubiquitin-binding protein cue5 [Rhizopus stolonifer]|uniref:Ubiquitin-binding protein cue5 n=1 Tax=Rhizopus stolonifer TaxID=4846 RepID=A0A367KLC2_RHIST|nr:ubiquitin-binding protein cue5 [Rhizopus stolonifer]
MSQPQEPPATEAPPLNPHLSGNVSILKEAFPETDIEVIEAVLQTTHENLERSFEILLSMSDPNVKTEETPPMPPRPNNRAPYAYFEQQEPRSVEDQLRMDEAYARQLLEQDEPRRLPPRRNEEQEEDSIFNFQEELPIIKEKMKEAGNAAKKKMMDLYHQFKANTQKQPTEQVAGPSMPTTNAQYRGLPSDDGDDLLTGDISALHLSDYDVYTQTERRQRAQSGAKVNPPLDRPQIQTSTSDAQLKADEDFARQLAQEEEQQLEQEARRSRQTSAQDDLQAPPMPARKPVSPTVVIAPRSPLEMDDSDYEGLTAATSNKQTEENNNVPYVIGDDDDDDDDSDADDLVDIEQQQQQQQQHSKLHSCLNILFILYRHCQ